MAETGSRDILTHSQLNAGDEYFDLTCTRCSKKKKNKQSVKYCVTCKQYFCKDCLEIHDDFHSSDEHVLVNTDSRVLSSRQSGRDIKMVPTELCKEHPMEVVNMYCEDDDSVGCLICFALNHRACNGIHYIPSYIRDNNPASIIDRVSKEFQKTIKHVETLKTVSETQVSDYEKNKVDCKQEMSQYRKEINDVIDRIEQQTLTELETKYNNHKQSIDNQYMKIQEMKSDLKRYQDDITSDQVNMAQKFVLAIMGQSLIKRSEELKARSKKNHTPQLRFSRNTDILAFLLNVLTLGLISSPGHQATMETSSRDKQTSQPTSNTTTTTTTGATGSSIGTGNVRNVSQKSKKQGLYKVLNKCEYNIKQSDDKRIFSCNIVSSCIVDDSNILLVDSNNQKLKLVDSKTYNIRSSLLLDAAPLSVCRGESKGVVVCLDNNIIQFISTNDKLAVTSSFRMEHDCSCITVSNNRMFVASYSEIHIYTLQGKRLKSFTDIKSETKVFSNISDITIGDDRSMIHIVDWESGVITLDMNGKICWEFSDKVLSGASGVCTDSIGNVIVCGRLSNNVIMLGQDGDYIGEIVKRQDGLRYPRTVCYDKNRNTLIAGSWNALYYGGDNNDDDNIKVFSLQ